MEGLISTKEVARILGISYLTARNWVHNGKLPKPISVHPRLWLHNEEAILVIAAQRKGNSNKVSQKGMAVLDMTQGK